MKSMSNKGCDKEYSKTRSKRILLEHEMAKYIALKNVENDENPLQQWRLNKSEFPIMTSLLESICLYLPLLLKAKGLSVLEETFTYRKESY